MYNKYKKRFSAHEAWYIFNEVAKKDAGLAIEKLCGHLHEYLGSQPVLSKQDSFWCQQLQQPFAFLVDFFRTGI